MTEERNRICSTRTALSEMLEAASRKLERRLRVKPAAEAGNAPNGLEEARTAVADLTARLAKHCTLHGC
jgi:hypothetical protein